MGTRLRTWRRLRYAVSRRSGRGSKSAAAQVHGVSVYDLSEEILGEFTLLPQALLDCPVVVIARPGSGLIGLLRAGRPDLEFRLIRPRKRLQRHLAAAGPLGAVVDLRVGPWRQQIAANYLHVGMGGRYLLFAGAVGSARHTRLVGFADKLGSGAWTFAPTVPPMSSQTLRQRDHRYLADALHDATVPGCLFSASVSVSALLKATDRTYDRLARARGLGSSVLERRPSAVLESRALTDFNRPPPRNPLHSQFPAPAATLRTHADAVCHPKQVAIQGGLVLPATFRRPTRLRQRNTGLIELAPRFVREPNLEPGDLAGTYYHLDNEIPGHFGHAMTETISRLWGLPAVLDRFPDVRVLVAEKPDGPYGTWYYDLLEAAGIARDRVTTFSGAVRVEQLVTASAMYSIGDFAHPDLAAVYDRIGARLEANSQLAPPERVFFTRGSDRRGCNNRSDVEALFGAHGFTILHPEDLTMADQAAVVRRAEVIAGFAGSNLLHLGLCGTPKRVIVITPDTYHVDNEHLLSALMGHHLTLVVSKADISHQGDEFTGEAYRSTFTFDVQNEGKYLTDVLTAL